MKAVGQYPTMEDLKKLVKEHTNNKEVPRTRTHIHDRTHTQIPLALQHDWPHTRTMHATP